ncbi:MAG: hypothetical protein ACJAXN_003066 [Psychromonas sp.]|jgi:hypothetical protein
MIFIRGLYVFAIIPMRINSYLIISELIFRSSGTLALRRPEKKGWKVKGE